MEAEFQHAAARRRLEVALIGYRLVVAVSTRSRPKAAEAFGGYDLLIIDVSTRSRPKVAEHLHICAIFKITVSTRSRPKVADSSYRRIGAEVYLFQHAAARRWLTHLPLPPSQRQGFNTQPPEGG